MKCPICGKECKGKIGVGVHLVRGHTIEERQKYYMGLLFDIMPLIITVGVIAGALGKLKLDSQKEMKR